MTQLIVDDEQAKLITESRDGVEILDRNGNSLGIVASCITPNDVAIAKARSASSEPRYSTKQVIEYLESLPKE